MEVLAKLGKGEELKAAPEDSESAIEVEMSMSERDAPELPEEKDDRLQAAIKKAEAEVERVKEWMAKEQTENGPRRSAAILGSHRENVSAGEPLGGSNLAESEIVAHPIVVPRQVLGELDRSAIMAWRQLALTLIAIIIATLGLITNSNRNTRTVVEQLEQSKLIVTDPPDGTSVALGQKVRGITPYAHLNHYIVVTMVGNGSAQVRPAIVRIDGTLSGDVRFSDGDVGSGGEAEELTIRVLATTRRLEPGNLTSVPDDAIFSRQVTVRRTKTSEQIVIDAPAEGADVSLDGMITGKTPFPNLNHYIVVESLKMGTSYVQAQPSFVNRSDATFSGKARFGGVGEQFIVRVLATKSTLPAALLSNAPADAVFSNSVTVTRKK